MVRHTADTIHQYIGLSRSLLMYYGIPFHSHALARFYRLFIRPGDLCFDIGAHVGSRLRAWGLLGAQIVALEPQPACLRFLQRWYGHRSDIVLLPHAVSDQVGTQTLWISQRTPTVTTLRHDWLHDVQHTPGFGGVQWDRSVPVAVTTLDALIDQYGEPAFCKIDVEGAETAVLHGLSRPIPALSFEYLPATKQSALDCIARLGELGRYEYNWAVSEWPQLRSRRWLSPHAMRNHLQALRPTAWSGDVYARRMR